MPDTWKPRSALKIGLVFAGVTALGELLVGYELERWRASTRALWSRIEVGDSEAHVLQTLGQPMLNYERDSAPVDYYVPGYSRCERPITNKVLIYSGRDLLLYVWIDPNGLVEETCEVTS